MALWHWVLEDYGETPELNSGSSVILAAATSVTCSKHMTRSNDRLQAFAQAAAMAV